MTYGATMTPVDYRHQTTLITGASSGIGAEFARRLARRGSDLVLVARRRDRLEALAAELDVRVTVIPLDLSRPGAGQTLAAEVAQRGLRVTSLLNNAGFGSYGAFHDTEPERLDDMIGVNVASLVDISRAFIDPLRAAGTGVLVNVASLAAYQPGPRMAVYSATKAFVLSFTEALWQESRGTGLRVLALSPGLTRTEFFDVLGTDEMGRTATYQTPGEVADFGLRVLDRRDPPPSVVSGRRNQLLASANRLVTRRGTVRLMAAMS
jgi:short-subunit dehydrogenase